VGFGKSPEYQPKSPDIGYFGTICAQINSCEYLVPIFYKNICMYKCHTL